MALTLKFAASALARRTVCREHDRVRAVAPDALEPHLVLLPPLVEEEEVLTRLEPEGTEMPQLGPGDAHARSLELAAGYEEPKH